MSTDLVTAINAIRADLGEHLLILGHHYQDSEVTKICDAVGDSLELSRIAAASKAEKIVFCGVQFMAETADILARGPQGEDLGRKVYLPAISAGCPMADMATEEALESAWQKITAADPTATYVPIVYVNSSAEVKAFCGRHGGSACTSGNGHHVIEHFLSQGKKIFFAPDQYLCTNILISLGRPLSERIVWQREKQDGGVTPEQIRAATLIAWDGCCPIHATYNAEDVANARKEDPSAKILIHPEAPEYAVAGVDYAGSTKGIIAAITSAKSGEHYYIGTEQHLVQRLIDIHTDLTIRPLKPIVCDDMGKTTLNQVLDILQNWPEDRRIFVPSRYIPDARSCVERMLAL